MLLEKRGVGPSSIEGQLLSEPAHNCHGSWFGFVGNF